MNQVDFVQSLLTSADSIFEELSGTNEESKIRFNVYRNNVYSSLIDALGDIFSVSKQLVGDDFFRAMARIYIADNPPKSPILNQYGETFPNFIETFDPAKSVPYLAELAHLERTLLTLTHSAEQPTLDLEHARQKLSQVQDPSQLRLILPKTSRIQSYQFSVGAIWWAHQPNAPVPLSSIEVEKPEHVLFVKAHLYGQCFVLTADEAFFISALLKGKSFEESIPDSATFDLGSSLAKFMEWQIFESILEC